MITQSLSFDQFFPQHVLKYETQQDSLTARQLTDGDSYILNGGFSFLQTPVQILNVDEALTTEFVFSKISVGLGNTEAFENGYVLFESTSYAPQQTEFWIDLNSTVTIQYSNDLSSTSPGLTNLPNWQSITLLTTTQSAVKVGTQGTDMMLGVGDTVVMFGLGGDDTLFGYVGQDRLFGNRGEDVIYGNDGHDKLWGNRGDDFLYGGDGDDKLIGGGGHDQLVGGAGDDWLRGGRGEDRLVAGSGDDILLGGRNATEADGAKDSFVFNLLLSDDGGFDRIRGFENGVDVIYLDGGAFLDFDTDVMANASERAHGLRLDLMGADQSTHTIFIENMTLDQFDASDVEIAPFFVY